MTQKKVLLIISFLLISTIFCTKAENGDLLIYAVGDGLRVDPVSGDIIEQNQDFWGPVVNPDFKENNSVCRKEPRIFPHRQESGHQGPIRR